MGLRGPLPEYDALLKCQITRSQEAFLADVAAFHDVTKGEVVRQMIDRAFAEALHKEVGDAVAQGT